MEIDVARTTCSFCPKLCRHECPVAIAEKTEVATPTFKQQVAKLASAGKIALDASTARTFYKCTGCLASRTPCRFEVEVEPSLRDARSLAVREGVAPAEVARVRDRFRARGSPFDRDLAAALAEIGPHSKIPREKVGVALFPACTEIARFPDEAREARAVLRSTGEREDEVDLVLPSPPCCGYPLDALGLADEFSSHARRVAASLAGYRRIVALGPTCAWTLGSRYREVGAKLA
ncbi:(Fe-S)-binding protein, partial [bacterium]|nr:(Fe-S)-binding protein [bacterium]